MVLTKTMFRIWVDGSLGKMTQRRPWLSSIAIRPWKHIETQLSAPIGSHLYHVHFFQKVVQIR